MSKCSNPWLFIHITYVVVSSSDQWKSMVINGDIPSIHFSSATCLDLRQQRREAPEGVCLGAGDFAGRRGSGEDVEQHGGHVSHALHLTDGGNGPKVGIQAAKNGGFLIQPGKNGGFWRVETTKNKIQFKEMGISPAKMVDFAGFNGLTFKNQDSTSQSFWDVMTCDSSVGSAIDKHGVLLFIYISHEFP